VSKGLSRKYARLSPEMINEIATGLEDPFEIAKRYDFTREEWDQIKDRPDYQKAVSAVRAEMERTGKTFRLKASVMADALMSNMYTFAMNADTPVRDKAAALQLLTKVADLEPKSGDSKASSGPAFSITINLPEGSAPVPAVKAEVVENAEKPEPEEPSEADKVLDLNFTGDEK
jgi:hypothetical protein